MTHDVFQPVKPRGRPKADRPLRSEIVTRLWTCHGDGPNASENFFVKPV